MKRQSQVHLIAGSMLGLVLAVAAGCGEETAEEEGAPSAALSATCPPSPVLDQQQLSNNAGKFINGFTLYGQSFTPAVTGSLKGIEVGLRNTIPTRDFFITLRVFDSQHQILGAAGIPAWKVLNGHLQLSSSTLGPGYFELPPNIPIQAGATYFFDVIADDANRNDVSVGTQSPGPYSRGSAWCQGNNCDNLTGFDLAFKTFVVPGCP
jgi:hypothetical protein